MEDPDVFVGLDVHKHSITIAIADADRGGEVRRYGEIPNTPNAVARFVKKLGKRHHKPEFVYEAGPCGYVLFRQLRELGVSCRVGEPGRQLRQCQVRLRLDPPQAQRSVRVDAMGAVVAALLLRQAVDDA